MPPLLSAILAQALAFLLIKLVVPQLPLQPVAQLILQGSVAALLGRILKLPYWWVPINLLLPLAVVFTLSLELPPWLYLVAFAAMLLIQWNSGMDRVPLYLSNKQTWHALGELLADKTDVHFVDLGSGLGGSLFYLASRYPDARFTGIESAPLPYALSRIRLWLLGLDNVKLRYGSLWRESLSQYNVIYAFLSPIPMPRLYAKVDNEVAAEGLFISNSFSVPGHHPDRVVEVEDRRQTRLYCWRVGGRA